MPRQSHLGLPQHASPRRLSLASPFQSYNAKKMPSRLRFEPLVAFFVLSVSQDANHICLCHVLTNRSQHGVDMNTPLVTPDGFPRADIDVVQSMHE